jgi:hypothetical protein
MTAPSEFFKIDVGVCSPTHCRPSEPVCYVNTSSERPGGPVSCQASPVLDGCRARSSGGIFMSSGFCVIARAINVSEFYSPYVPFYFTYSEFKPSPLSNSKLPFMSTRSSASKP